jgi:hypothetical protein
MKAVLYKIISLMLLVGGLVLLIFGIKATNGFDSDISKFLSGFPSDKAILMLISGAIVTITGLGWAMYSWKLNKLN